MKKSKNPQQTGSGTSVIGTTSGPAPLNVTFPDTTTGSPTSWSWDFGDGTNSTEQNPSHIYEAVGMYNVSLMAANAGGSNATVKEGYINVTGEGPVADFSADPTSGNCQLSVQFMDNSTGSPTSWNWSFGDGTFSTDQNPSHTYTTASDYTVSLTVTSALGENTKIMMDMADVQRQLIQLMENPDYHIVATPITLDTFSDPPQYYIELLVDEITPENKRLDNTVMQGWKIFVRQLSPPPTPPTLKMNSYQPPL